MKPSIFIFGPKESMIDSAFRELVMGQIEVFLLTGHDTTSLGMVKVYHLLSKHSSVLTLAREEHASVFCPDLVALTTLLMSSPLSLNEPPLTFAVIQNF